MTFLEFQPLLVWIGLYLKLFAFVIVRPLFFCFFFMPFSSVLGRAMIIRFVISATFVFPVFFAFNNELVEIGNRSLLSQWGFIAKEAFVGLIFGMLLSIPFWLAKLSGGFIDVYRGENNSEHKDEAGELLTTTSKLLFVTAVLIFTINDGFIAVYEVLYSSYIIWPIGKVFIFSGFDNYAGVLALADAIFRMILLITLPLFIFLLFIEFSVSYLDKMSQSAKMSNLVQIQKSLGYLILLPIYVYFIVYFGEYELNHFFIFIDQIKDLGE